MSKESCADGIVWSLVVSVRASSRCFNLTFRLRVYKVTPVIDGPMRMLCCRCLIASHLR